MFVRIRNNHKNYENEVTALFAGDGELYTSILR